MTTERETNWVEKIGGNAYSAILEMVQSLQCDWERLAELREERDDWDAEAEGEGWADANPEEAEELAQLEADAGDCESEDDARDRITEDPLSLEYRSGWTSPGQDMEPEEFCLLLATGGPAVRIVGEIGYGEAARPRLQVQDWGKPWTEYLDADQSVLEAYCQCFCFDI